jgi:hypothetical protein
MEGTEELLCRLFVMGDVKRASPVFLTIPPPCCTDAAAVHAVLGYGRETRDFKQWTATRLSIL